MDWWRESGWRRFCLIALVLLAGAALFTQSTAAANSVLLLDIATVIHPLTFEIVTDALAQAEAGNHDALVIRINTPGGLLSSTQEIVQAILASPVPVVVYVAPSGGRAASAGFIILVSADVAAMAPGTNTGAASPVLAMGGEIEGTMKEKVENDTTASLRAVTARRGRNTDAAAEAVLESKSYTEQDALEANLIDIVAGDLDELLTKLDSRVVTRFDGTEQTLSVDGAQVEVFAPSFRQRVLLPLISPSLAMLVLMLGLAGIYVEFSNPGLMVPGVLGGIFLIVGLMSLSFLPINYAGVALILLGLAFLVMEAFTPLNGILATGGVIAMVIGMVMLVDTEVPELQVGWMRAVAIALPFAVISVFLLGLAIRSFRYKVATGAEAMVGEIGVARSLVAGSGSVFVHGELWNARSAQPVDSGQKVRVVSVEGLTLVVQSHGTPPSDAI